MSHTVQEPRLRLVTENDPAIERRLDAAIARHRRGHMEDRMLQFFAYEHLPEHLQAVSRPFGELAKQIVETLPSNPERTVALRKLVESKDCAVRALLCKG